MTEGGRDASFFEPLRGGFLRSSSLLAILISVKIDELVEFVIGSRVLEGNK